jgi:hypothetical protein
MTHPLLLQTVEGSFETRRVLNVAVQREFGCDHGIRSEKLAVGGYAMAWPQRFVVPFLEHETHAAVVQSL